MDENTTVSDAIGMVTVGDMGTVFQYGITAVVVVAVIGFIIAMATPPRF